jgi:hypothetical protein
LNSFALQACVWAERGLQVTIVVGLVTPHFQHTTYCMQHAQVNLACYACMHYVLSRLVCLMKAANGVMYACVQAQQPTLKAFVTLQGGR